VLDATQYAGAAALIGNDGNDTLIAGPGLNLLEGDAGDDLFIFKPDGGLDLNYVAGGAGTDTLDFSAFSAGITVNLSLLNVTQNVVVGEIQIRLVSIPGPAAEEIENIIGGGGADTITGNSISNRITGGGGADILNGGGGTNTIVETADADFVLTNASLSIGGVVKTLSNFQRAELTGGTSGNTIDASAFTLGSVTLSGGAGNDRLIGGTGNDVLIGGADNDLLRGGAGSDIYRFDVDEVLGEDTVDELPGAANGLDFLDFRETTTVGVTIDLSLTTQQTVQATNLKLTLTSGSSIEYALGGDQADTLIGNSLDNGFIGGLGADIIRGGAGNNFLVESRDADFLLVSMSATTATLTITTALGSETDSLTEIQLVSLTGGASNNLMDATAFAGVVTLSGLGGNDSLYGGSGNDTLLGGDGEDLLRGNGGDDDLRGGNDSDTYVFDQSFQQGSDTITEEVGQGAHDTLLGVGLAGVDVDLYSTATQPIGPNLKLTLNYPTILDLGQIEHSL
jgi:Ca2+-binding RTX toxin-like protein